MTVTQGGTLTAPGRPFAAAVMRIIRARAPVSACCGIVNTHRAVACGKGKGAGQPRCSLHRGTEAC